MLGSIGKQTGESVESVLEKKRKATVVISARLPVQNTRSSTHTYHSRRQKFCCRRTARVEQFTGCYKTDHQLRTV